MATAAMTNLIPNFFHHNNGHSQNRQPIVASGDSRTDAEEHNAERNDVVNWSQGNGTLSPEEVAKNPNEKCVGHSARHLGREDFEFIRTLGTGI